MSNPAVIVLDIVSRWEGKLNRFHVEDNIGESIHIHIDDMRFDFTIDEFFALSELLAIALEELDLFDGHSLESFDIFFLKDIDKLIPYINNISIEEISISKLKCINRYPIYGDINWLKLSEVSKTPAFKFLNGFTSAFISYKQENRLFESNAERINNNLLSIKKNGYPFKNQHVIVFNNQNVVRDGQHRVSSLAYLFGVNSKIKIMRINFNNKFRTKIFRQNVKNIFLKIIYKAVKVFYKKIMYFIKN